MNTASSILQGKLPLPGEEKFKKVFGTSVTEDQIKPFWRALWTAFLNGRSVNLTYWAEQFSSVRTFNSTLKALAEAGWINSHALPARNWAEAELKQSKLLEYVTEEELDSVRAEYKFGKYVPRCLPIRSINLTKQNGRVEDTGLVRYGLAKSGLTRYSYDTKVLSKYRDSIVKNTVKGMEKVREQFPSMPVESSSYDSVAKSIVSYLADSNGTYSLGTNLSDSRGRAIKEALKHVANPVGYKDFRALLVIPEEYREVANKSHLEAIYLFIAELNGFKEGSLLDKELFGALCYEQRKLPNLDLSTEEGREDLHERIWLERIYAELDRFFSAAKEGTVHYWSVPIELDASASMLSHMGLLLGDKRLLEMTNTHFQGYFNDPWKIKGVSRAAVKAAYMPRLYGSSASYEELLKAKNVEHDAGTLQVLHKEAQTGAFGLADTFKEFIIQNVKPKEEMVLHVYEDVFKVACNRHKNIGEKHVKYDVYDSISSKVRRIVHTKTRKIADLEAFRRYFVTGLIHSLDSQVLDFVMEKLMDRHGWGIDIHDAVICSPSSAANVRNWYAEELQVVYDNRDTILQNYFRSIGITSAARRQWEDLKAKIVPVEGTFKASGYALK